VVDSGDPAFVVKFVHSEASRRVEGPYQPLGIAILLWER